MKPQKKAYLCALAAVLCWSTIATAFSLGLREMDGLHLILGASLIAIVCLLVLSVALKQCSQFATITFVDLKRAAVLGFLNPFAYYIVLLKAYTMLPAQEAMVLNYMWPVVLVVLSIPLLRQKVSGKGWLAILLSFYGVFIVGTRGDVFALGRTNLPGDALALGSAFIWALYWIFNVRNKRNDIVKLVLNLAFGSLYLLLTILLFSELKLPSARGLIAICYVGVFEIGLTFLLWLTALRIAKSTAHVSQLIFLSPFISLFWIQMALREVIHPATLVGLAFVIAGTLIQQYIAKPPKCPLTSVDSC